MLITIYHWGVHAWGTYIVVALAISLASYRFRLPMIFRSTFYPILGEYTWGWMGDFLDGTSIVVTIAGLCTSLGLGSMQMAAGLSRIGWVEEGASESDTKKTQIIVIWVITFITACSVMMGLHIGIKYLSLAAFSLGMILLLAVFMMDKSSYIINLTVQSFGQYLHYVVFQLPFHTDAFGQLKTGEGRAIDENAAAAWWFDAWTIFYVRYSDDPYFFCIFITHPTSFLVPQSGTGGLHGLFLWVHSLLAFHMDAPYARSQSTRYSFLW